MDLRVLHIVYLSGAVGKPLRKHNLYITRLNATSQDIIAGFF